MKEETKMNDNSNYHWVSKLIVHYIKISKLLLFLLAVILVVGGLYFIVLDDIIFKETNAHNSHFFQLMSDILLIAAAIHLSIALCFKNLKELGDELIAALLMAAFSITLVMLHEGIEIFLNSEHSLSTWVDAPLLLYTLGGALFMVFTIYLLVRGKEK